MMNKELWGQKIKRVLDQIGLGYLWTKAHENDIGMLNIIKQRLKDIELQRWLSDVHNDVRKDANQKNKLRTFRKFKTIENYKNKDYLRLVSNIRHRITLTKLCLSNHKLAVETGRYVRPYKKPEERICPICKKRCRRWNTLFNSVPCVSRKKKYFIWVLKKRIQNISKQNVTRWCFSVVNKPSVQEQTSAKVNWKIHIRLLWEKKIISSLG